MGTKMDTAYFEGSRVSQIAQQLLGKVLITKVDGEVTAGMIVETEAYSFRERGCHAYLNKRTPRNQVMFKRGGHAYVYLCYGIHHLFNIVTNTEGKGDAVLVRALQPTLGVEVMMSRVKTDTPKRITAGPGKLSRAMGIDLNLNGAWLGDFQVWIEEGKRIAPADRIAATRIGIDYAGSDALLPWRYYIRHNEWVSRK
jgi:DNA-3-methyladenine glycosylase